MSNPSHFSGPMNIGNGAYEELITDKVLTSEDSGKVFGLNLAAGIAVTLPKLSSVKQGFEIEFRAEINPEGGAYVIAADAADVGVLFGNIVSSAALAADTEVAGGNSITFADGIAFVADIIVIKTNGTAWYVHGQCAVQTGLVFA